jgi:hypothetical protein
MEMCCREMDGAREMTIREFVLRIDKMCVFGRCFAIPEDDD